MRNLCSESISVDCNRFLLALDECSIALNDSPIALYDSLIADCESIIAHYKRRRDSHESSRVSYKRSSVDMVRISASCKTRINFWKGRIAENGNCSARCEIEIAENERISSECERHSAEWESLSADYEIRRNHCECLRKHYERLRKRYELLRNLHERFLEYGVGSNGDGDPIRRVLEWPSGAHCLIRRKCKLLRRNSSANWSFLQRLIDCLEQIILQEMCCHFEEARACRPATGRTKRAKRTSRSCDAVAMTSVRDIRFNKLDAEQELRLRKRKLISVARRSDPFPVSPLLGVPHVECDRGCTAAVCTLAS
jgi:hypothetical protein